ncbi:SAM-dependent methyltransferase, partial [Streptomyces scabiei]
PVVTPPAGPAEHASPTGLPSNWFTCPATSRIDNYLTGGCDHFAADRNLAGLLTAEAPWLPAMVKINQRHRSHAVTALAKDLGITQFLDLGCGLPSRWNRKHGRHDPELTHEAARAVHAGARVVYLDNDPMVCGYARLASDSSQTTVVQADLRRINEVLDHPGLSLLDRAEPIAVLVHDVLPWLSTTAATRAMTGLHDWLSPGSTLSVTHATADMEPAPMWGLQARFADTGIAYQPRSREEIQAVLNAWSPAPGDLVPTAQWRAGGVRRLPSGERCNAYAAILTKTPPAPGHHPAARTHGQHPTAQPESDGFRPVPATTTA